MAARIRPHEGDRPLVRHALPLVDANDGSGARRGRVARAGAARPACPSRLPADRSGFRARAGDARQSRDLSRRGGARMKAAAARALMALAVHSLGESRREWSAAMQAELETAVTE